MRFGFVLFFSIVMLFFPQESSYAFSSHSSTKIKLIARAEFLSNNFSDAKSIFLRQHAQERHRRLQASMAKQ